MYSCLNRQRTVPDIVIASIYLDGAVDLQYEEPRCKEANGACEMLALMVFNEDTVTDL